MESNIARVLLKTNDEPKKQNKTTPQAAPFDPALMIDMFPGPALLVDGSLKITYQNIFANSLLEPLQERDATLKSLVGRCLSNHCPDTQKVTLKDSKGLRHYDLYAFPLDREPKAPGPLVFLFGRETTIEHNLTTALVESRQMFKDLVSCSADFAWETDSIGNFIYVSPKGILGYTAYELNGKNASDLIVGAGDANPFDTLDKITESEIWVRRADGAMACLLISAVPVLDNTARWRGARGVCRDITPVREREAALRSIRKREHILSKIVSSIRDMISPADMLETAVRATMDGIKADFGCILRKTTDENGEIQADMQAAFGELAPPGDRETLRQRAVAQWRMAGGGQKISAFSLDSQQVLMGLTRHHATDNGAIFLVRHDKDGWREDETLLFDGVTTHLGIAIEQAITREELEKRAFTDELTQLLNRRAFRENVEKRLQHQIRSHRPGALLYIDLDNFKNVNDRKGHAHGDTILKNIARHLRDNIRVGDFVARLGGDEFAVWLDDAGQDEAEKKAQYFVDYSPQLQRLADVAGPGLSLSIGIALSDPGRLRPLDNLLDEADKGLYQAKANSKATYVTYAGPAVKKPGASSREADHA